ncbi:MAG: DNA-directed RNA polymerase subunit A' [Candidatus Aenigmatarchaeota archaeon]|nr:DNA-directed RNA polymerase subunit A' [Candidatus Aenigmarchaeota archaeon]
MVSIIKKIEFKLISPQEAKKLAVMEVTKSDLYDNDGFPVEGGPMDPRLGVIDPGLKCRTCGLTMEGCLGHFGYIELVKPVIHVLYANYIYKLLKITCRKCSRIMTKKVTQPKKCPYCGEEQIPIKFEKPYTFIEGENILNPLQIRERFEKIPDEDLKDLKFLGGRPEWLILTLFLVPPVLVRPSITLETGERSEDDLTHKIVDILRINQRLKESIEIGAPDFIISDLWELLQYHVATFFDNSLVGIPTSRHRSGRPLKTLADRLRTKEGRFRHNLAGKRVNFAARTVISPDPFISIDEVGVPLVVAKDLTIPVYVTKNNIEFIKTLILNPSWPSANYIIRPDGRKKKITDENREEIAKEIAPGYIVHRHLQNGDIVLFNRQPSLHRVSMMAHRVRVTPWRTFTLNICTCPPYNADFDGDEMNLHVLQNEEARAEAALLMAVPKHIRSPRYGGPLIGAEHDHVSGLYSLTKDGTEVSRETALQLLFEIGVEVELPNKNKFTGKEIFSYLLPKDLNIEFKSKSGVKTVIKNGKLIEGVIDANAIGREKGKIIDILEKEYGTEEVHKFIDRVSKLGIKWLEKLGFTIGLDDFEIVSKENEEKINSIIENGKKEVEKLIEIYKKGELECLPGRTAKETVEVRIMQIVSGIINSVRKVIEDSGVFEKENCAIMIAKSGARGSLLHLIQIAGAVGQEQSLGERIHRGYTGRTLSHFKENDLSLDAHGFVGSSFKTGLKPYEFFFDAVSGRGSLMDKSLRTRHSGYLERRLMNALQDLKVEYDGTIRDNRKIIVQFNFGEDGIDPSKSNWGTIDIKSIVQKFVK